MEFVKTRNVQTGMEFRERLVERAGSDTTFIIKSNELYRAKISFKTYLQLIEDVYTCLFEYYYNLEYDYYVIGRIENE